MIVSYVPYPFSPEALRAYLQVLYGAPLRVLDVRPLDDDPASGRARIQVELDVDGRRRRIVVERFRSGPSGLRPMPDRARRILAAQAASERLPRHARALDVGVVRGGLQSLGGVEDFFLVAEQVDGRRYADDLERLARCASPGAADLARADALCAWMASVHDRRAPNPDGYGRHLGGLLAEAFAAADAASLPSERLRALEHRCVDARRSLQGRRPRLRIVHGDLRAANILFQAGTEFTILGGGAALWGDPAEDLAALTLSYALAAWPVRGRLEGALRVLHDRLWRSYVGRSGDAEVLDAAPLLLTARALVLASAGPSENVRDRLLRFAERSLDAPRYDPDRMEA